MPGDRSEGCYKECESKFDTTKTRRAIFERSHYLKLRDDRQPKEGW